MVQTSQAVISIESPEAPMELVGGKGHSLAKLSLAMPSRTKHAPSNSAIDNLLVPPWFIITTATYKDFIQTNSLAGTIQDLVKDAVRRDAGSIETASTGIQSLFANSAMPTEIIKSIASAYIDLGSTAVAVRSSATAEDLPDLSFAGQQDSYLNIYGETELLEAVRNCWASLWTSRAIGYRLQMGIDQGALAMGVVVQSMVEAEVSGILFTANPASGDRTEIVINASYGLGESIAGGKITPDTYVLDRSSLAIKDTVIGSKEVQVVSIGKQGVVTRPVAMGKQIESSVSPSTLRDLARLSIDIEQIFDGIPQDIEWAQENGKIFILQSRPITRLPVAPLIDVLWEPQYSGDKLIRRQVVENMPDPLSPLFSELYLQIGLEQSIDMLMNHWQAPIDISDFVRRPIFVTVNGYAYSRANYNIPWRKLFGILVWYLKFIPSMLRDIIPQWQDDGLPVYLAAIEQWKSIDIHTASDEHLLSGVQALATADADYWCRVAMVMGVAKITDGALHTFLSVLVKGKLISGMFLRGFPSKTMEAEVDLEMIANQIRATDSLRNLVNGTPAIELIESLKQHASAAPVSRDIQIYFEKYGHRIYTLDFVEETQIEQPLPVLLALKKLTRREDHTTPGGVDTNARQKQLIKERDLLARQTLASIGPVRRWIFRKLLRWAQHYGPYREEALFYMGAAWPVLRKFAFELGRRLVKIGTLSSPDRVFYLNTNELTRAFIAREEGRAIVELGDTASDRYELREARKKLHPPPMVPEGRFMFGFIDMSFMETQKRNAKNSNILKGFAVSPGRVTGTASVIMSPADFENMKPDTILVCPATTPAWTTLFSQASALVTDIGGILAHGSIVAREYGIPAVMGTGNITRRIVSGTRIVVDGTAGTVTILD